MPLYRHALLVVVCSLGFAGCRACGTGYDYAPPVANCQLDSCSGGHGRAGSVLSGVPVAESAVISESPVMATPPAPMMP